MKKLREGRWENILLRGWNMALSCLDEANWSENIYLGVTLSRQRQVVDLKAITFEQHSNCLNEGIGRVFAARIIQPPLKCPPPNPPSRLHQRPLCSLRDLWAQKVILRRYKDSASSCKPVLGPHSLTDEPTRPFCKPTPATKDILKGNVNYSDGGQLLIESSLLALLSHSD